MMEGRNPQGRMIFRIGIAVAIMVVLFFIGRPIYWKLSASATEGSSGLDSQFVPEGMSSATGGDTQNILANATLHALPVAKAAIESAAEKVKDTVGPAIEGARELGRKGAEAVGKAVKDAAENPVETAVTGEQVGKPKSSTEGKDDKEEKALKAAVAMTDPL